MGETKRNDLINDLHAWGFDDQTLKDLENKGWRSESIYGECKGYLDTGYSKAETVRNDFESMFPGLFGGDPADGADVFSEFGFYSVPDLTDAERKPPEFIVDGMVPCGMTVLSGAPKTRKSFLALQMAIAVATGNQFLGLNVHQCDVAYLDFEGSKSRNSSRSERMSIAIPRNVFITNFDDSKKKPNLADGTLVEKLRMLHRQHPSIRLIIVDTYSKARGNFKANGANAFDGDVVLLDPIHRMVNEENISVFFVHHDSKGAGFKSDPIERASGSMGITASADSIINLILDGKRSDGKAHIEYTPRDAKGGEMNLEFNPMTLEWNKAIEAPPVDLKGNPVCMWIVEHAPERHKEGQFYPYDQVYREAYHIDSDKPGDKVIEQVKAHETELFSEYRIAVQTGVLSHSRRGIRIVNLL